MSSTALQVQNRSLKHHSFHCLSFSFEKMISGMYMGEIVRLVICELVSQRLLFGGEASDEMFTPKAFLTKYISEIER